MRGLTSAHPEKRHRLAGTFTNLRKKGYLRSSYAKDTKNKPFSNLLPEGSGCKMLYLKLILLILMCVSFMSLLQSPAIYHSDHRMHSSARSTLAKVKWIWNTGKPDSGYVSNLKIDWSQISKAVQKVDGAKESPRVGLLNFNVQEIGRWRTLLPHTAVSTVNLDHIQSNVTWEHLYPEWIDEEELSQAPTCPDFPEPKIPEGSRYDLVAVKLPCSILANWSRDVPRLHLQLAAARVAAYFSEGQQPAHVLIVSRCFPIPNLFKCKYQVMREGRVWLYKPEMMELREKLMLPVGSCKLALPFKAMEGPYPVVPRREAYATILHSEHVYVCGAITAAQSIRLAGSNRDLIILVDETISNHHRSGLEAAGWKIKTIKRIRYPKAAPDAYNEWNYSKFWLWTLTEYDKIIFIDADLIIQRKMEILFNMPEISATGNNGTMFNSGVMVIEPSNCTFQLLMDHINEIESYNGGDQGYLNEIFSWWHRLPSHMNYLKHFWEGDTEEMIAKKTRLFGADPPIIFALHFVGMKPWLCFKDYDCNWNVDSLQEFASDAAHARWWKVHDTMTPYLQKFCLLNEKQKALLHWDIMHAKAANSSNGHWRMKIKDPRRKICSEEVCQKKKIQTKQVEGNRITTSYTKLIGNF